MTSTLKFNRWENAAGQAIADAASGSLSLGRNLLYNGAMQVAQRGTSETGITGSGYYTADRWRVGITVGTWTQTVEADGPTGSGFSKSLKMEVTTADAAPAAGVQAWVRQSLEGQDLQGIKKGSSDAESLTLSFWVKSDTTGTYAVNVFDTDNTRLIANTYTIFSAGTWEKKTFTFAGDTTGVLNNDNGNSLEVYFWLVAGSNFSSGTLATSWESYTAANRAVGQVNLAASNGNYWQVTGVQLETGTVASGFDHKPYGTELAECQRYYYEWKPGSAFSPLATVTVNSTTAGSLFGAFPVTMRANPSAQAFTSGVIANDWYLEQSGASKTVTGITPAGSNTRFFADIFATGLTAGSAARVFTGTATNSGLAWSAEL